MILKCCWCKTSGQNLIFFRQLKKTLVHSQLLHKERLLRPPSTLLFLLLQFLFYDKRILFQPNGEPCGSLGSNRYNLYQKKHHADNAIEGFQMNSAKRRARWRTLTTRPSTSVRTRSPISGEMSLPNCCRVVRKRLSLLSCRAPQAGGSCWLASEDEEEELGPLL